MAKRHEYARSSSAPLRRPGACCSAFRQPRLRRGPYRAALNNTNCSGALSRRILIHPTEFGMNSNPSKKPYYCARCSNRSDGIPPPQLAIRSTPATAHRVAYEEQVRVRRLESPVDIEHGMQERWGSDVALGGTEKMDAMRCFIRQAARTSNDDVTRNGALPMYVLGMYQGRPCSAMSNRHPHTGPARVLVKLPQGG